MYYYLFYQYLYFEALHTFCFSEKKISGTESNTRLEQNTDGPVGEAAASAIFTAGKAHLFLVPSARTAVIMTL